MPIVYAVSAVRGYWQKSVLDSLAKLSMCFLDKVHIVVDLASAVNWNRKRETRTHTLKSGAKCGVHICTIGNSEKTPKSSW
ncbi:MAG: hypothetical protein C5B53_01865 [Candidatus Melainabacteria bacterium]|nr:MAG: hypothetical protein C5B53_01865 [Candidatus Melainabacteria bacterium]